MNRANCCLTHWDWTEAAALIAFLGGLVFLWREFFGWPLEQPSWGYVAVAAFGGFYIGRRRI